MVLPWAILRVKMSSLLRKRMTVLFFRNLPFITCLNSFKDSCSRFCQGNRWQPCTNQSRSSVSARARRVTRVQMAVRTRARKSAHATKKPVTPPWARSA